MVTPGSGSGRSGSYYAATAPAVAPRPALAGSERADVCIVGAGFTGISAALHLAERGYSVIVLEAERVGWGASGRNGGQVGSGMRESMDDLERTLGPSRAESLWALSEEAKAIIAERIARHGIECDWRPGNLLASTRARYMGWIEAEAEFCQRRFGYRGYRMLSRAEMREEVASDCYVGGRMDAGGGHLHPLRFVLGMAAAAAAAGARIFEGSRAERIRWGRPAEVSTARGVVTAEHVVLAGNAHLGRLEPRIEPRIMPIVNHQLATEPLGERRAGSLARSGACVHSTKFVVDYFRCTPDHRLLFGGGETYSDRPPDDLAGVRSRLPAPRLPPARGREDRPCVERPARDHHEPPAARGAGRPERLLRPRVLGPRGGPDPDRGEARRGGGGGDRRALRRAGRAPAPRVSRGHGGSAIRCSSSGCSTTPCATSSERSAAPAGSAVPPGRPVRVSPIGHVRAALLRPGT